MSRTARFISALGAVFFAVVGLTACGGGVPSDSVAKVGGTSVTNDAFQHWMTVAAVSGAAAASGTKPVAPDPPHYTACMAHLKETNLKEIAAKTEGVKSTPLTEAQLKKQCETQYKTFVQEVMGFLLSSQWVLSEAEAKGIKVSDQEVKNHFNQIKNTQFPNAAEFQKFLATSGQTVSDLLLRVKLNLLSTKIQQKITKEKGHVTEAQVEKYYNENKSRFGTPEKRDVETILTKNEAAANQAKKEIESGKSFASVAKAVSVDNTTKNNGGLITGLTKGTQAPALDEAEFSAQQGTLSGPIKTPLGYTVFRVKNVSKGSQQALSQLRATIRAQLAATGQQEALTKFVKEFKTHWKGQTECRSGYVVADCKEFTATKSSTATTSPEG